jgi:hypothetical protein
MAIPTFTSVTPNIGPAGGLNAVTIVGSGFQLPPTTPAVGTVDPKPPTVAVEFDGFAAMQVDVIDAATLRVVAPAFQRTSEDAVVNPIPKVAITVRNIDANGDLIPGETVTATAAYQFQRSKIRPPASTEEQQVYRQVIREVTEIFRRQLLANTHIGTNIDFGDRGEITIKQAHLPSITLTGPRISEDMESRHHWADYLEQQSGDTFERYWPAFLANFEFSAVLASNRHRELYGMAQGFLELCMRNPFIRVPITHGDTNGPHHEFPLHLLTPPAIDIQDANSNLIIAIATFEVRWVPFRLDEPVYSDKWIEEGALESGQIGAASPRPPVPFAD